MKQNIDRDEDVRSSEQTWWQLTNAFAVKVAIFVLIICILIWAFWGGMLAASLALSCVGILLAAITFRPGFDHSISVKLGGVGVICTAVGYGLGFYGALRPISNVVLTTELPYVLKVGICDFDPKLSRLTCPAVVEPKK